MDVRFALLLFRCEGRLQYFADAHRADRLIARCFPSNLHEQFAVREMHLAYR